MQLRRKQERSEPTSTRAEECLLSKNIPPTSYGSVFSHNKGLACRNNISGHSYSGSKMSFSTNLRRISATEVVLPPVKWYKQLYVPCLVAKPPSSYSNSIRTTKYTILNFLPKNLWEQFHRWANLYFLFIALLNFVPAVEAVGKEVAFIPLLVILSTTIGKDIFEDYRRFKSDREVNGKYCQVYDRSLGAFRPKRWESVRVGEFVQLLSDDVIPADLLLLQSSDPTGICYIETANIDGETNLKQRQVASSAPTAGDTAVFNPLDFKGTIHCEPPHKKIYEFNGYIETADGATVSINKSNLLLRGCVVRNTRAVVGVVVYAGHETKSMLNNSGPRAKRSKLERTINIDILAQVLILVVLCLIGAIANGVWISNLVDLNAPFFLFTSMDTDIALEVFIRFWTFLIIFQVIVPISLYVTMEIVKLAQVYFINWDREMYYAPTDKPFQCRALNIAEDLGQIQHIFSDKTGTLTENQMVFRCCSVGGVNYPHTLTAELAEVHRAGHDVTSSRIEESVDFPQPPEKKTDLDPKLSGRLLDPVVKDFFTVLAVCNTVIVSRASEDTSENREDLHNQAPQDLKYEAESPDEAALVQAARDYGYPLISRSLNQCSLLIPEGNLVEYDVLHTLEFDSDRKCMSVILRQKGHTEVILYSKGADSVIFRNLKCSLESGPDSSHRSHSNDAASVNHRLSGGAMGVALMRDRTQSDLDDYAKIGLRTLCMAKRVLTEEEYEDWLVERHRAEVALEDRDNLLKQSCFSIESNMQLLGATGIEDKLQTGVPEAISSLQAAGMKLWVLTGDKQETAINIGFSSHLIHPDNQVVILNMYSLAECKSELLKIQQQLSGREVREEESLDDSVDSVTSAMDSLHTKLIRLGVCTTKCNGDQDDSRRVLVVDGGTLVYALDPSIKRLFLSVADRFHSVMCCRATPLQKAAVVELVKCGLGKMTLAIGDGANDASMIQKADVGVGIAGREGMQAVMASDFAMARFQFLVKLLLVHGHWCYGRLARLILYFFYKNVAFAVLLFWFQIFNGFSGSSPIDSINLLIFNLVYTSLPIIVVGVADQDLPAPVLLKEKVLYQQGRCSQVYTHLLVFLTVMDAFYQSAVVFFVALGAYYLTDIGVTEFGFLVNTSIVIVVSLHLAIETLHWTVVNHIVVWGSIIFTFVFNYIYCAIDTQQRLMDTLYVMQRASSRAEFWFVLVITPIIALLPRLIAKVVSQEVFPTPVMAVRARWKKNHHKKVTTSEPHHTTTTVI